MEDLYTTKKINVMSTADLKEFYQKKLDENFNIFLKIERDGQKIMILPLRSNIPTIENIKYSTHYLEIVFSTKTKGFSIENLGDNFECYLNDEKELVGIKINNLPKIQKERDMQKICEPLNIKNLTPDRDQDTSVLDFNKRLMNFLQDIVKGLNDSKSNISSYILSA